MTALALHESPDYADGMQVRRAGLDAVPSTWVRRDASARVSQVARPGHGWPGTRGSLQVVALVPAHNEEDTIASTIESLLSQHRRPDRIVVICDNCTDGTFGVVSQYPVTAVRSVGNPHGKSGALNQGWRRYATDADVVVCADADTVLPPNAVQMWLDEMRPGIGGISAQVVMTGNGILERMQRAEFTKSTEIGLRKGFVNVISGTGCCFSGEALREVSRAAPEQAPWSHASITEDFHLTYQIRRAGWQTIMSSSVQAHTAAMPTVRALWHQRIKWHVGTISDLMSFGVNKLTWRDWLKQAYGAILIVFWVLYLTMILLSARIGTLHLTWVALAIPLFFSVTEAWQARLVHRRSWKDILLAASLIPTYFYAVLVIGLVTSSWLRLLVLKTATIGLWGAQYRAERGSAQL
jgi:cellulose synthase/poly-beta-1,6-N-acetylglucosamine synthase-like glycosyltransferase